MQYNNENIFAKILKKEIPSTPIYEDDKVFAFNDIAPKAKTHILVIPKGEFISFIDFTEKSSADDVAYFFKKVEEIAKNAGLESYRIVANCGADAGQVVPHFHIHILSGDIQNF
ncbi:MAG: HIT domain-containing protein [Rickettsiales bacterium]|nr:MAG: HIT domain-containing protein [Rickettsiales bacterium]